LFLVAVFPLLFVNAFIVELINLIYAYLSLLQPQYYNLNCIFSFLLIETTHPSWKCPCASMEVTVFAMRKSLLFIF